MGYVGQEMHGKAVVKEQYEPLAYCLLRSFGVILHVFDNIFFYSLTPPKFFGGVLYNSSKNILLFSQILVIIIEEAVNVLQSPYKSS